MTQPISFEKLDVSLTADMTDATGQIMAERPFHMLILGDFSGRANRQANNSGSIPSPDYRAFPIEFEHLDQLMARLNTQLVLPALKEVGTKLSLTFQALEDFHPDRLLRQGEALPALMSLHQRLDDPSTFAEATAEMQAWGLAPSPTAPPQESKPAPSSTASLNDPGDILTRMLGTNPSVPPSEATLGDERSWQRFVEDVVSPYLVPDTDPQQPERLAQVEQAMGDLMRTLLHQSDFQFLESAWRGLNWLTQRLELSTQLKLFIVDLSKAELAADLTKGSNVRSSKLAQVLIDQARGTLGGQPWAVVAGNYIFDQTPEDIALLEQLAKLAQLSGAPFLAQANSQFIGGPSLGETPDPADWPKMNLAPSQELWQDLRCRPEAPHLGLALPRFLLRLPYGQDTEPIETWSFKEMEDPPAHEDYLWGNPIFACLELIGKAFMAEGWNSRPGEFLDVEGLPLHIFTHEGESQIKPCAEVLLTEQAAETILNQGLIPLLTIKDHDVVRLARFQSIADPLQPLAGQWQI